MNPPLPSADAGTPQFESTSPSPEIAPRPRVRRLPLAPIGGLRWLVTRSQHVREEFAVREKPRTVLTIARPRRMRRCARTVLLWGLLWYAVVQLFPLCLKNRWQLIGTANEERKLSALRDHLNRDPDRPLLLMLGSSRTCWAFRAAALDGMPDSDGRPLRVFNFGIPATGPIYQLLYLRDFLAEGIRPRFLLIEVLPPLLCEAQRGTMTEEGMTGFAWLTFHRMWQWWPYLRRPERRLHAWIEARIMPWYAFRRQLQLELNCRINGKSLPTHEPVDSWGWHLPPCLFFPSSERERRLRGVHAGYSQALGHYRLGKKPTKAFHELLDLCRQENIPAALVVMPESSQFRSWYSEDGKAAIRGLIAELTRTYGVEVIDGQRWLADEDFEDGHHALLHGADVFTYRLHAELPRLLARSKGGKSD